MDENRRQSWIDRAIQDAQDQGLFDNLQGRGRPIDWEDESLVDEEWLMAFRIMREQGFAPEWIELHKEIGATLIEVRESVLRKWRWRQERLLGARESERRYIDGEWRRAHIAFTEAIAEINAKIVDFNLMVPLPHLQKFKLDVNKELADLGIESH
jgi:DnaJ family protein C protein 28